MTTLSMYPALSAVLYLLGTVMAHAITTHVVEHPQFVKDNGRLSPLLFWFLVLLWPVVTSVAAIGVLYETHPRPPQA